MNTRRIMKAAVSGAGIGMAMAAVGYAALVVLNRAKYGAAKSFADDAKDSALDRFIPNPEVAERHEIEIHAPVHIVLATAKSFELLTSPLIRAVFRARELALGAKPCDTRPHPAGLYEQMTSLGWVVLSEQPGCEIVFGAATQPVVASPCSAPFRRTSSGNSVSLAS